MSNYRLQQYAKLSVAAVLAVGFIVLVELYFDPEPILIGSMIGALPLALFELDNRIKKPHVICTNVEVVKYPKRWFSFEREAKGSGPNSVCVRATIQNDGFQTAEDCTVDVSFGRDSDDSYSTKWTRGNNPTELSLSQDESQKVDLFFFFLDSETIQTAVASEDDSRSEPYPKSTRYEVTRGRHTIQMSVAAANMPESKFRVSTGSSKKVDFPNGMLELAKEADVVRSVKQEEKFAIHYFTSDGHIMEIPEGMSISDLTEFQGINEVVEGRPFAAHAREKYDLRNP